MRRLLLAAECHVDILASYEVIEDDGLVRGDTPTAALQACIARWESRPKLFKKHRSRRASGAASSDARHFINFSIEAEINVKGADGSGLMACIKMSRYVSPTVSTNARRLTSDHGHDYFSSAAIYRFIFTACGCRA